MLLLWRKRLSHLRKSSKGRDRRWLRETWSINRMWKVRLNKGQNCFNSSGLQWSKRSEYYFRQKYIFRFFKNLVFLRKIFGCQPVQNDDQTDTKLFSIYQDIKNNPNKWLIFTLLALTYLKSCIIFMIPSCTLISNPVCPSCKLFLGHALTFLSSMSASIASVLSLSTSSVSSIKLPFFLLRSRKS